MGSQCYRLREGGKLIFRVYDLNEEVPIFESPSFEKAKWYAELYKKNLNKESFIQKCETIWSSQTLDELLKED